MSNKKQTQETGEQNLNAAAVEQPAANNSVKINDENPTIPNLDSLLNASADLDNAEVALDCTAAYIELNEPGARFRGIFIGETIMSVVDQSTGELVEKPAVRLLKDKKVFLNGGVSLVREFRQAKIAVGTAVEIEFLRKESKTKIYAVRILK